MFDKQSNIKITAIIVTLNEDRYLEKCLNRLSFCDQIIVYDMYSTDSSVEIAKKFKAEIRYHQRVPAVESVRKEAAGSSKNEWIIFLDPDEILPENIGKIFGEIIIKVPDLGVVYLPWQFYFNGKPLTFTIWGFGRKKAFLFHRKRCRFSKDVHNGYQLLDSYKSIELSDIKEHGVDHYWNNSYKQLFAKHIRYIKTDGQARYNQGQRFSWITLAKETCYGLKINLIDYNGLQNGFTGFFLSLFYSWYIFMSYLSLYRYEKAIDAKNIR